MASFVDSIFNIYKINMSYINSINDIFEFVIDFCDKRRFEKFYRSEDPHVKYLQAIDIYHNKKQENEFCLFLKKEHIYKMMEVINKLFHESNFEKSNTTEEFKRLLNDKFSKNSINELKAKLAKDKEESNYQGLKRNFKIKSSGFTQNQLEEVKYLYQVKNLDMRKISRKLNLKYHRVVGSIRRFQRKNKKLNWEKISQRRQRFSEADLKDFFAIFTSLKNQRLSGDQIFRVCKEKMKCLQNISYSYFYQTFMKNKQLSFKKEKISCNMKNPTKKGRCRLMTIYLLTKMIERKVEVLFFDESTFQMANLAKRSWCFRNQPNELDIKHPCQFVKLMMITSLFEVTAFKLQIRSSTGNDIYTFLKSSINAIMKTKKRNEEVVIVLDNAPKNRIKKIKNLTKNFNIRLFYITPTSPDINFIENLFFELKRQVRNAEVKQRYVYY